MDFSEIDLVAASTAGADCHIEHPVTGELLYYKNEKGEEKPIIIRVYGQDSKQFRAAVSADAEKSASSRQKVTANKAQESATNLLAQMVISWEGIEWEQKPLKCTFENVRMFLTKFPPIRYQLDQFIADRANFFSKGGTK